MTWWGPEFDDTSAEAQFLGTVLLGVILFFILRACAADRPVALIPDEAIHPYAEVSQR